MISTQTNHYVISQGGRIHSVNPSVVDGWVRDADRVQPEPDGFPDLCRWTIVVHGNTITLDVPYQSHANTFITARHQAGHTATVRDTQEVRTR